MKKPLILVLFFSFFSYSQEGIIDYLLVEKDSSSFYTFTKEGVYFSSFDENNKLNYSFNSYTKPPPKTFKDVPTNTFSAINLNGVVYLLYPGGGMLYQYSQGAIERIDESFPHRNQFAGFFFAYNDELYLLGGYGYWASKNFLTKFNFDSRSWEFLSISGETPKGGINQGSFIQGKNSIYVFDFFSTQPESLVDKKNDFLYELNLSKFLWIKKGRLSSASPAISIEEAMLSVRVKYGNSLFERAENTSAFRIVDPLRNCVKIYSSENELSKLSKNSIFIGSKIVYASQSADNSTFKITFAEINSYPLISTQKHVLDSQDVFLKYIVFSSLFLAFLIIFLFAFFKNRDTLYSLSELSLFNEKGLIILTKEESQILQLFADSIIVENNSILEVFSDESKSFDAIIKRKNKAIKELNVRFNNVFNKDLIFKKADNSDSRQVVYSLAAKTRILNGLAGTSRN
mgnify:FL=1